MTQLSAFVKEVCGGSVVTKADEDRLISALRELPPGRTVTERLWAKAGLPFGDKGFEDEAPDRDKPDQSEENVLEFYKIFPHWVVLYPLLSCPICEATGKGDYSKIKWMDYRHQAIGLWGGFGQVIRCVTEAHDWTAEQLADWLEIFFASGRKP